MPDPTPAQPVAPLSAGRSVVMPAGASFAMTNVGTRATQVVVVTFAVPQVPGEPPDHEGLPRDVVARTLAGGMAADVGVGPGVLTLGQMVLARGAQRSLTSAEGPILIAVETGQLRMMASEPAWIRSGLDGGSDVGREASLAPGDGVLQSAGGVAVLWNVGDDPVVALVLTLRSSLSVAPSASPPSVDALLNGSPLALPACQRHYDPEFIRPCPGS